MLRRPLLLLALVVFMQALRAAAGAESYPARPVRMVVAYPAGGSTDTTARVLAKLLSEKMNINFFIERRSGAGGVIGADYVAKSAAMVTLCFTQRLPSSRLPH